MNIDAIASFLTLIFLRLTAYPHAYRLQTERNKSREKFIEPNQLKAITILIRDLSPITILLRDLSLSAPPRGKHRTEPRTAASPQRILQPLTGPPWKKLSGVTTPSRLNTVPSFMTNCTSRRASISSSGLPATAMMSAAKPTLRGPRSLSMFETAYPFVVRIFRIAASGIPAAFQLRRKLIDTSPRVIPGM